MDSKEIKPANPKGVSESCSVVSDFLQPHGLYSPWNSPGQNTGMSSLSLLQGIFPTQGLIPGLPHCRRILYQLRHKGSLREISTQYSLEGLTKALRLWSPDAKSRLIAIPWTAACQASLSFIISQSLLKVMSIESVMPSNHLILCHPLLLPSVFPSIRFFSNESALHIRWPKYWSFSISPFNEYSGLISFRTDWFDLLPVSRALSSITV